MYIWLVCCGSIRRFRISFALNRLYYSLTLKERGIHVYLPCLLWQYPSIDNFFRSKWVMLIWLVCCGSIHRFIISFPLNGLYYSLTPKEQGIHVYLPRLLWQYPLIDNFVRSKQVMFLLTLKERGIHVYLARLLWQYPSIDNFFRPKMGHIVAHV